MPKTITVTFADGSTHVYQNAPDTITPDQVEARATKEFGKPVAHLDGSGAPLAPAQPKGYFQSIGDAFTGAAAQLGRDMAPKPYGEASKPLAQQAYDMTIGGVADAVKQGVDIANMVEAPLQAAAMPLGHAANAVLPQRYAAEGGPANFHFRPLSGREADAATTNDLLTATSLGLPTKAAMAEAVAAQAAGGAPASGAEALSEMVARRNAAPKGLAAPPPPAAPPASRPDWMPSDGEIDATVPKMAPAAKPDALATSSASGGALSSPATGAAPALAPEEIRAAGILANSAQKSGVNLADAIDQARTSGTTVAENIGTGGEAKLAALGRREGTTGEQLTGALMQRTATLPQRLEDAATGATGIDRTVVDGDIEKIVGRAQAAAKPLYDAYEALPARTSPELDSLLATPHVRKALESAITNAKNERAPAHEIQNLQQLIDGLPTDTGPAGDPADYLAAAREYQVAQTAGAAKALRRARGASLNDFLANKGGLSDTGGDVAAMDGDILHKGNPFQRKLVKPTGMGLDDAAQAAWESGYFPHHAQAPEVPEFLDAIRRDMAGDKFYAAPKSEQEAMAGRVGDFEELLRHHDIDPTGKSAAQLAKEVADRQAEAMSYEDLLKNGTASTIPGSETITRQVPTPRVLNDIKKVLDKDYIQRKLAAEVKGSAPGDWSKDKVYAEFKGEVEKLFNGGFDYKGMQAAGGDAPKIQEALRSGKKLMLNNDFATLKAKTTTMSPLEKKTALGGFVRDVLDRAQARQGISANELRLYATDDFAKRVSFLAGDPSAGQRFQVAMGKILLERRGMRMMPRTNSITGEIGQANAELDASGLGDLKLTSLHPKKAALDMVGNFVMRKAQGALDTVTTPGNVATRNALGAQLIDPEKADAAFKAYNAQRAANGLAAISRRTFDEVSHIAAGALGNGRAAGVLSAGGSPGGSPSSGRQEPALK